MDLSILGFTCLNLPVVGVQDAGKPSKIGKSTFFMALLQLKMTNTGSFTDKDRICTKVF
jgi:hypothetical protein